MKVTVCDRCYEDGKFVDAICLLPDVQIVMLNGERNRRAQDVGWCQAHLDEALPKIETTTRRKGNVEIVDKVVKQLPKRAVALTNGAVGSKALMDAYNVPISTIRSCERRGVLKSTSKYGRGSVNVYTPESVAAFKQIMEKKHGKKPNQ